MKVIILALFLAAAMALPVPDDDGSSIDVVVNGVAEGEALDLAGVLNIKVKEHVDGELVSSSDVLHPYSAQGIAEAIAAAAAETAPEAPKPEVDNTEILEPVSVDDIITPEDENEISPIVNPEPIVLPTPALPVQTPEELEIQPEPIVLPEAPVVEVNPEPIALPEPPAPEVNPEPVALPEPATPEVFPGPVVTEPEQPLENSPAPASQGDLYNDGLVQVSINHQEPSMLGTLQSWFNMVINYVGSSGATETNQIV